MELRRSPDSSSPAMPAIPSPAWPILWEIPTASLDQAIKPSKDSSISEACPSQTAQARAQYQLAVEALDPLWSAGVCPYDPSQVAPSGTFEPIVVTVAAGGDFEQDILMSGSAQPVPPLAATETWSAPAPVPSPGDWVGSLSGYGDVGYFLITAQANRTLSVAVTALDETGAPSESKAAPVVGMWTLGDPRARLRRRLPPFHSIRRRSA